MTKMSQDEVISLTYSSPLRVNVRVPDYFVQVQVFLLKEFTECASEMSVGEFFHGVAILLRRECVLGSFLLFCSRES